MYLEFRRTVIFVIGNLLHEVLKCWTRSHNHSIWPWSFTRLHLDFNSCDQVVKNLIIDIKCALDVVFETIHSGRQHYHTSTHRDACQVFKATGAIEKYMLQKMWRNLSLLYLTVCLALHIMVDRIDTNISCTQIMLFEPD